MSRRLVVDDCVRVRHGLQGESTSLQSDERSRLKEGSRDLLQAGNAVGVSSGSSDVVDAVAVLVRMTPGVEYIKASSTLLCPSSSSSLLLHTPIAC